MNAPKDKNKGFSLLECVVAIFIITIGLLAVAALSAVATKTESFAYSSTEVTTLASSKMEELKAGTLGTGGSLISNDTGFFDTPDFNYYRRWKISNDVAGTKKITVVVVPQNDKTEFRPVSITTLVR